MGLEGDQSAELAEETVDRSQRIDDEPTTLMDSAERNVPDLDDDEPTHSADDVESDPAERTKRMRADEIDRRALPFKKSRERRGRRAGAPGPTAVSPVATTTASVWSREGSIDPRDLPSSLAPTSGNDMPPSDPAPRRNRTLLAGLLMAAFVVLGFVTVALLTRCS